MLTALGAFIIPNSTMSLCAARSASTRDGNVELLVLSTLRRALDVVIVPNLAKLGKSIVKRSFAFLCLIVSRSIARKIRFLTVKVLGESVLQVRDGVRGGIRRTDACLGEPFERRQLLLPPYNSFIELKEVIVLCSLGALGSVSEMTARIQRIDAQNTLFER